MATLGLIFPPDQPPEHLLEVARAAELAGIPELWLWEDCFAESGIACAATVLAATTRLRVGIGLMPVPLRNVALTAPYMHNGVFATLHEVVEFLPGIGHGVLDWMGQAGVRAESPLTLLREYGTALRDLLDGAEVTTAGRYVQLDRVALRHPPTERVPLWLGGAGPKTIALAAEIGDGLVFDGGVAKLPTALAQESYAARPQPPSPQEPPSPQGPSPGGLDVVSFLSVPITTGPAELAQRAREMAASGATRIPVCAVSAAGPPDNSPALGDFAEVVGAAAALLGASPTHGRNSVTADPRRTQ